MFILAKVTSLTRARITSALTRILEDLREFLEGGTKNMAPFSGFTRGEEGKQIFLSICLVSLRCLLSLFSASFRLFLLALRGLWSSLGWRLSQLSNLRCSILEIYNEEEIPV